MAVQTAFESEVCERLSRMERELRYWRLGGVLTLSVMTVIVSAAMDEPPLKELRAETLKIVERNGKERIVLTAVPGVPDMTFLDPSGESRLTLDIADDHKPVLSVSDLAKGKGRLVLGIEDGSPTLHLFDRDGKRRVRSRDVSRDEGQNPNGLIPGSSPHRVTGTHRLRATGDIHMRAEITSKSDEIRNARCFTAESAPSSLSGHWVRY
jgi:hypothetical protein